MAFKVERDTDPHRSVYAAAGGGVLSGTKGKRRLVVEVPKRWVTIVALAYALVFTGLKAHRVGNHLILTEGM